MKKIKSLLLTFVSLSALFFAGSTDAQTLGYWRFDEKTPGNTTETTPGAILDQSGNGNAATATAAIVYTNGSFNYGGTSALRFTLSADAVTVPDPSGVFNFSPAQSFTMEALIRTVNIGQDGVGAILSKANAPTPEYWWRINTTGLQQMFISDGNGSRSVSGTRRLNDGLWHHIAVVYDAQVQQLRSYVDYQQDGTGAAVITTGGTIGTTNDLKIGAFETGTRQFDGDMDFARVSLGALSPDDFVQPVTYISEVVPATGFNFVSAASTASFRVRSTTGVTTNNIQVISNGTNISSQLSFTGTSADWMVTLPALVANKNYANSITVTDSQGRVTTQTVTFNTFDPNSFTIEGEDYNFGGGQFIDNPQLSGNPAPDNYLDRIGTQQIDYAKTNPPVVTIYRIGDAIGTAVSGDMPRQKFIDAQANDPGVADYVAKDFVNGEWVNYSRTFPSATYHVYARLTKPGTVPVVINVDEVTLGSTTASQTLSRVGTFRSAPTLSSQNFVFVPLTDALGNEVSIPLSGVKTLRLTMVSGPTGLSLNYFLFVPAGAAATPYISALSPLAGAGNETSNVMVHVTVRNGDTSINTVTTQLKLDATTVAPSVSATATGAQINYTANNLSLGLHTVTLTFSDNNGTSVTNSWQFRVANQAVRGYWNFNEKAPGNVVSLAPGAILDSSGNARNGTATDDSLTYVNGSFNYGNTSALRFTVNSDRVVVPDPSGSFNFTGAFTWEAVIKASTTGTTRAILAKNGTGDGEGEYWWRMPGSTGTGQQIGLNDTSGAKFLSGTTVLNDGQWHHVAVVYDTNSAEVRLYADYQLDGVLTNVVFTNTLGRNTDLTLGSFNGGGSDFDGDIDAIRMSSGALTTNQFIPRTVALSPALKSPLPKTNAVHVFPKALVQAEFMNRDTQVLLSSYKIYIDGNDITASAIITTNPTGSAISYTPTTALADGLHTALVTFNDTATPANFITNQWSFSVVNSEPFLALWKFDEKAPGNDVDVAAGSIIDSTGNGHNGTVVFTNAPGLTYVDGSTNHGNTSALEFILSRGAHITVPDPSSVFNFTPAQSITMEAIIKTTNIGQASVGAILAKQGASPGEWYWRIETSGFQRLAVNDGSGLKTVTGTKKLNDNNWYHVAVIYDGVTKQIRAYVNYNQDGNSVNTAYTSTTNIIGNLQDLWIGAFQANNRLFDGQIDAIRITAAPLDPSWFIPLGGLPAVSPQVQIINVSNVGGNISFNFATENGRSYIVQSAGSLTATFTPLETIIGDGSVKTVSYPAGATQQFFRISAN